MSALAGLHRIRRAVLAFVVAMLLGTSLIVTGAGTAQAANRDVLRAGCIWDTHNWWVQRCDVWSEANGRNIPVQIVAATQGGNAAYYMLDGLRATNHSNAWLVDRNAAETFEGDNITLVMPVGGKGSFYADWDGPATYDLENPVNYQWETFLTRELPAYLQQNFGVDPTNNAISGLSMGGTAALNLAAKHPGQFKQVLSFSGYPTTTVPGAQTALRVALLDAGGFNLNAMYGSLVSPRRFENDPFLNMDGLRNSDVYVSAASGIPSPADANIPWNHQLSGAALEALANVSTKMWAAKANATGIGIREDYPALGMHNWNQFGYQMEKTRPLVLNTMNAHRW
ncbi:alpha/beta hydrolase [Corynebacterium sp.]|uniref:alpha/beta hydrolase n=1 Tax=Corynebacterium sp. TaxID=1720 RepID=UPI003735A4D5